MDPADRIAYPHCIQSWTIRGCAAAGRAAWALLGCCCWEVCRLARASGVRAGACWCVLVAGGRAVQPRVGQAANNIKYNINM